MEVPQLLVEKGETIEDSSCVIWIEGFVGGHDMAFLAGENDARARRARRKQGLVAAMTRAESGMPSSGGAVTRVAAQR
jgi:hypothetical protein